MVDGNPEQQRRYALSRRADVVKRVRALVAVIALRHDLTMLSNDYPFEIGMLVLVPPRQNRLEVTRPSLDRLNVAKPSERGRS